MYINSYRHEFDCIFTNYNDFIEYKRLYCESTESDRLHIPKLISINPDSECVVLGFINGVDNYHSLFPGASFPLNHEQPNNLTSYPDEMYIVSASYDSLRNDTLTYHMCESVLDCDGSICICSNRGEPNEDSVPWKYLFTRSLPQSFNPNFMDVQILQKTKDVRRWFDSGEMFQTEGYVYKEVLPEENRSCTTKVDFDQKTSELKQSFNTTPIYTDPVSMYNMIPTYTEIL